MFLSAPQHLAVVPGPRRSENNNWKSSGSVINAVLAQINNDYQQMILGEPRHGEITKKNCSNYYDFMPRGLSGCGQNISVHNFPKKF